MVFFWGPRWHPLGKKNKPFFPQMETSPQNFPPLAPKEEKKNGVWEKTFLKIFFLNVFGA